MAEKETEGVGMDEAEKGKPDSWRLEPQPIREDQVENAVKFLSNAKVRASPIVHRRSFLERKGLTREEIDEAFRRCPDPPSSDSAATVVPTSADTQAKASTSQAVVPGQNQGVGQLIQPQKPERYTWGQTLLGLGTLVAAGACTGALTKVYLIPKFKAWVRSILLEGETNAASAFSEGQNHIEPPVNEAATAATAAAAAASEVASAMRELAHARVKESQQLGSIIKALETQTQELKSALSGMKDVVNSTDTTASTLSRGYRSDRSDVWRTPEMPRPSGMLTDRTFAGVVSAPAPTERIDSPINDEPPVSALK